MNNAHLKLNSMSEFTALWNSGERFRKFAEQVYRYLERRVERAYPAVQPVSEKKEKTETGVFAE